MSVGKKRFNLEEIKIPHTYVIIFSMIIIAAIMTYLIPAGEYARIKNSLGITVVDPSSCHYVEQNPAGIMGVFSAVPEGLKSTATLVFFLFIIGGVFQIINCTGTINILVNKLSRTFAGKEEFIIPVFLFTFSLGGALMGMSNEVLAFVPIGIMLARKSGFDAAVGTAMVTMGALAGFSAGTMNPFNVGVAQEIAELPLYSGIGLRIVLHLTFLVIGSIYLMRYAKRVKADPSKSIVADLEKEEKAISIANSEALGTEGGTRHILVLLTFVAGLGYILYGVFRYEWGIMEMQPIFMAIGIIGGLLGGLSPNKIASEFLVGAKTLAFGALVIGFARGILVVMQHGMILDTIVHSLSLVLQALPSSLTALGMFVVHIILNFFIPSGSGQAAATMPLFIPLADVMGISRQVTVLAFQLGDGISNGINPTSSNMNSFLGLAKITYPQWIKFAGPLILMWELTGAVFIVIAGMMNYGPF
ncbi:MAG: TIGR00366 family protein [Cloacibacillus sp.]|nr:TIGR00366 family protein [Cloacibacillus sp.]